MEPDLGGQEKDVAVVQVSQTEVVVAMEPDLGGQEKE